MALCICDIPLLMEKNLYSLHAELERGNWYYSSRRAALSEIIERHLPDRDLAILDVGCGTGFTTDYLRRYGHVVGVESDAWAVEHIRSTYPGVEVSQARAQDIGALFSERRFDLVTVLGVLYHRGIDDPAQVLKDVSGIQTANGWIIWHEAAYPSLERDFDQVSHGARRFQPEQMEALLQDAGYAVRFVTHMASWAYPIARIAAWHYKRSGRKKGEKSHASPELKMTSSLLNRLLYILMRLEWKIAFNVAPIPIGVSCLVVAQKKEGE